MVNQSAISCTYNYMHLFNNVVLAHAVTAGTQSWKSA